MFYVRFALFNNKYIKPLLIRKTNEQRHRGWSIVDVCKHLNERDAKQLFMASSSLSTFNEYPVSANNSLTRIFSTSAIRYYFGGTTSWRR